MDQNQTIMNQNMGMMNLMMMYQNQMIMNQNMGMMNQMITDNQKTISVIFKISNRKPITISCQESQKNSDLIQKYRDLSTMKQNIFLW